MKLTAIFLLVALAACGGEAETKAAAPTATPDGWDIFGAQLEDGTWLSAAQLMGDPDKYDGKIIRVEGKVDQVCKKKGCWLTMRDGDKTMRVRFKDYGFFVPLDCEQRVVRLEGEFKVRIVPEAEAKHYLEDAGKPEEAKKLTGDQRELSLLADGVRMRP